MYSRLIIPQLQRTLSKYKKSILLLGPRQTGKSTLLRALKPDLSINLAREQTLWEHNNDPELLARMMKAQEGKDIVVMVDEIQRLPSMLNTIQDIVDTTPYVRFMLSGSSARKLKKSSANLLPGRILQHRLHPLCITELADEFDLMRALSLGTLPEIYSTQNIDLLDAYVDLYLKEEIKAEAVVRQVNHFNHFNHFLPAIALSSGQELNYSQLGSDTEVPKETIRRYVDVLDDTLMIHRVPCFHHLKPKDRKVTQKEKMFFFDLGVGHSLTRRLGNTFTDTELGSLFEQFIFLQLKALNDYLKLRWELYYYRDHSKLEVDFIVHVAPKEVWAIEVKWSRTFRSEWTKPLEAFASISKIPVTRQIILYRGEHPQRTGKIEILPFEQFFSSLTKIQ